MDIQRFRNSPLGVLEPIRFEVDGKVIEHFAFVPNPLPESLELESSTYSAIEAAATALGMLEGSARQLEDPYVITRPVIRREAQSTSAIEGTYSTLEHIFAADISDDVERGSDEWEVWNYVLAAEAGVERIRSMPVSFNVLRELHQVLMNGTEDQGTAGRLRESQVAIGPRGATIQEARFVPPPAGPGLADLVGDWEKWNYREDDLPLIARVAVSHYQFETIHPFMNGNGRIGRLVVILLLIDLGPLTDHFMVLSPFLETRRSTYQDLLASTTATGDFNPWITFFARAIEAEAIAARERINALLAYPPKVIDDLRERGLKGKVIEVANGLIRHPVMKATTLRENYGISYQSANRIIGQLENAGVLVEVTGGKYNRIFVASEVMRLLRYGPDQ